MTLEVQRTIVVGVDGSEDSRRALRWALEEAERRGAACLLVHGVDVTASAASPYGGGMVLDQLSEAGRLVLDQEVEFAHQLSGVPVTGRFEIGSPAHALIEASRGALMLVVGSRGHGGFREMLLGSVSHACVHHAHCPVLVVRHDAALVPDAATDVAAAAPLAGATT